MIEENILQQAEGLDLVEKMVKNLPDSSKSTFSYTNNSVSLLGNYAFQDCLAFHELHFGSLGSIPIKCFSGCVPLETFSAQKSNYVFSEAFSGCDSLRSISLPECFSLDSNTFNGCATLQHISIPRAASIGKSCFFYCSALNSIDCSGVRVIGETAFYGCSSLQEITLSEQLEGIGANAFSYCSALERINYLGTKADWLSINGHNLSSTCVSLAAKKVNCADGELDL